MSRARAQSGPTISLFPFLAVLLCTMGSLLVVLVIFSRSAKESAAVAAAQARAAAEAAAAAEREELELARDELGWRIDHVRGIRDRSAEDLAKARMQLAGTEEQARQLADELDSLARVAEALEAEAVAGDEADVLDLERRLADARKALDEAKERLAERPPAYAVVPYEGASGTHRRPLYIECCIDGVYLQPEGIRLGPADFEGPPGPGNPLASALRVAREHIARNPGESGNPNVQPYPLLLVRPSGVMAYYAARESIQSWGSEFGYQFIDEDWTLNYPPRDAALADAETRAIEEARRRLEWLAQVRPPKRSKPAVQYRAATTRGGVVSNNGPSVLGDQSRFDWTEGQAAGAGDAAGRGFAAGGGGSAAGASGDGTGAGGDAILGNRYAGPSKFYSGGPGGDGGGDAAGGATGDGGGSGLPGTAGGSPDLAGQGSAAANGEMHGASPGDGQGSASAWDTAAAGGSASGSSLATAADGPAAGGGRFGQSTAAAGTSGATGGSGAGGAAGSSVGTSSSAAGGGGGGSGPSVPGLAQGGGAASVSVGDAAGASPPMPGLAGSLAGKRGSNWASLATAETPVPLTRPIRVECAADEFRLLGDGGRVQSRIPIGTHTVDSVDLLVREVHATVGRWGLAGERMYWRPELVLSATADGAGRREDLEKLLADSGIDTRRSEVKDKVRNLPPVQRTGGLFPRR
ncbi:MAG: hypothetical protein ACKO40_06575 [Planctomycetaceae bacterium]